MTNAQGNQPQDKDSGTSHVKVQDATQALAGFTAGNATGDPNRQKDLHPGPLGMTARHPRGLDVSNDGTLDDTVDTDGKNIQAKRDMEMREREPDSVITSNATPVNFVPEPGDGLGGFDSRPARNGLLLALERGFRLIDRGMVSPQVPELEEKMRFEARDPHGHTLRGRKHYALNHLRPSRLFEIERREG
jgi:hypothetical protein